MRPAPDVGQDSFAVLMEAGFDRAAIDELIKAGAVMRIPDADALGPAVVRLLSRDIERRTMGEAAHRVMERERGAVERTMAIVERVLAGEFE